MPDTVKQHARMLVRKFDEREEKSGVVNSAEEICKSILNTNGVYKSHKCFLLRYVQCIISERNGKFATRYRSKKTVDIAINCPSDERIQHEHVFTAKYISKLIQRDLENFKNYLNLVVGCEVLKKEHDILSDIDEKYIGWERYKKANIGVYDMKYHDVLDIDSMINYQNKVILKLLC